MKILKCKTGIIKKERQDGVFRYYPVQRIYFFGVRVAICPVYGSLDNALTDIRHHSTIEVAQKMIDLYLKSIREEKERNWGKKIIAESFIEYP